MSALTSANVDYESMVMRFNRKKSAGRSAHAAVVTPLNNELLRLIGNPKDENDPKERIFNLPHTGTDEDKDVDVGNVEVQIKQDPTDDNNYRLHLGGKRGFQWFKEKWQSLKQTVKNSFRIR